ncbi:MAG: phosphodiester glycosidase family protein, partial [Rhizobiaceae bacterium]
AKGMLIVMMATAVQAEDFKVPARSKEAIKALGQSSWQALEDGLDVMRIITGDGLVVTSYRISPSRFNFDVVLQDDKKGSRAREIGEREGAVLVINGGFFAERDTGMLYSIGYLKLNGVVQSKGWNDSGGLIVFKGDGLELIPTHKGIPKGDYDVLQSKPMIIEPGGIWALGSNLGETKHRTMVCRMANEQVIFILVTRSGLSLYEAGWMLRSSERGGFFGCDSAVALDGGRSTQVWYSGRPDYSYSGIAPVQNFIVVRQRDN